MSSEQSVQIDSLFEKMDLKGRLDFDIFKQAMSGYFAISPKNERLIIIDYSQNSTKKRLFVIDVKGETLIYNTLVSHGKNSGFIKPTDFSNKAGSKKSSLGFFLTAETYHGKHGLSLKLDGLEKGINDNARDRAIVIHTATYANNSFVKTNGYLGRSWGCPALPTEIGLKIIDDIKDEACLYIYAKHDAYFKSSKFFDTDK
ncbi:MAG: murein L,D-transpeptidase catalytic domain family protein [Flavobacteriales bacterium]|nr:murein L,D-transpeptidase catalytic domain family protein [Flavobacteriales bacterium]